LFEKLANKIKPSTPMKSKNKTQRASIETTSNADEI
jgi:hypothetical protein